MMVYDERAKKYVRRNPGKPIGTGKQSGCTRSMKQGTDIQHAFKAKVGVSSIYHKWA